MRLVVLVALAQMAIGSARADDVADCESNERARVLAGCTRLIDGRETGKQELLDARVNRADALLEAGDGAGARADLAAAASIAPDNGRVHLRLGLLSIGEHKFDTAIAALSKARELDARLAGEAAYHLGRAFAAKGDHANAVAAFDQAEQGGFKSARLAIERARALAATGHRDRALKDARRVLERDPADVAAKSLSRDLVAAGKVPQPRAQAAAPAVTAQQQLIDRAQFLVALGDGLAKSGEHAKARMAWQAVLSANVPAEMKTSVAAKLAALPAAPTPSAEQAPAVAKQPTAPAKGSPITGSIKPPSVAPVVGPGVGAGAGAGVARKAPGDGPRKPMSKARATPAMPIGVNSGQ